MKHATRDVKVMTQNVLFVAYGNEQACRNRALFSTGDLEILSKQMQGANGVVCIVCVYVSTEPIVRYYFRLNV